MADLDFGKNQDFVGNYDFWKQSSELVPVYKQIEMQRQKKKSKNYKFVARFSANASKSKQTTSRKKMLDKIELEEIIPSSRKYPFINFKSEREIGNDLLTVENLRLSSMVKRFLTISTLSYVQVTRLLLLVKTTSKQLLSFVRLWAILNMKVLSSGVSLLVNPTYQRQYS